MKHNSLHTTTLEDGSTVLAKPDGTPLTYGNRAQAQAKLKTLQAVGRGVRTAPKGRFYVTIMQPEKPTTEQLESEPEVLSLRNPAYDGPDGIFADYMNDKDEDYLEPEDVVFNVPESEITPEQRRAGKTTTYGAAFSALGASAIEAAHEVNRLVNSFRDLGLLVPSAKSRNAAFAKARRERLYREARTILAYVDFNRISYIKHSPLAGCITDYCAYPVRIGIHGERFSLTEIRTLTESGVLTYRRKRKQYKFNLTRIQELIHGNY